VFHELRLSYQRVVGGQSASDPASERIPSIEVGELGMMQNAAGVRRTAIGLPTDLPRSTVANRYQLQSTFGVQRTTHSIKFGIDFQRDEVNQILQTTVRGPRIHQFAGSVDDVANSGRINSSLPVEVRQPYNKQYDYAAFVQMNGVRPNLSLTYGIRYESPGNLLTSLAKPLTGLWQPTG
jgi:outer membrane receptor protein involved in Fe transport